MSNQRDVEALQVEMARMRRLLEAILENSWEEEVGSDFIISGRIIGAARDYLWASKK